MPTWNPLCTAMTQDVLCGMNPHTIIVLGNRDSLLVIDEICHSYAGPQPYMAGDYMQLMLRSSPRTWLPPVPPGARPAHCPAAASRVRRAGSCGKPR